jgi:hypothetical protein
MCVIGGLVSQSLEDQAHVAMLMLMSKICRVREALCTQSVCFCIQTGGSVSTLCLRSNCKHVTEVGGP